MPTEYGLYQHVVPPLIYMFLGTCKENSVGSHALISLVFSQVLTTMMTAEELADPAIVAQVATALTMLIGLFMIGLYVLRMSWISTFLADPAVTGFFAGMVVMTVLGQVASVLQLKTLPDDSFTVILERIFGHLPETNVCSLVIGVVAMLLLVLLDRLNARCKLSFPIPRQLIVIILGTIISFAADLHGRFELKIIGAITSGFPRPSIPSLDRFSSMILPAVTLTLIVFVNTVSIAKTMSTAHGYEAPASQEMLALGVSSLVGSWFRAFAPAGALSRSLLNNSIGSASSLWNLVSIVFVVIILVAASSLLEALPNAVLAAIIIEAHLKFFLKFQEIVDLWRFYW